MGHPRALNCFTELKVRLQEEGMLDGRRRPEGRFFIGMLSVLLVWWGALAGTANAANGAPAATRVSDIVSQGDGTASGILLISWPAFTTSDAKPVYAKTAGLQKPAAAK